MSGLGGLYLVLIILLVVVDFQYASWSDIRKSLSDERVVFSIYLSLITCSLAAIFSIWVAVPTGYVLARLGGDAIQRHLGQKPWANNEWGEERGV